MVILKFSLEPGTTRTGWPSASTSAASSVASRPAARACACASRSSPTEKACGVCASQSARRSTVPSRKRSGETLLMVSWTGTAASAAPWRRASASTRSTRAVVANGRAPSWMTTYSMSSGRARRPAATESCRSRPPATAGRQVLQPKRSRIPERKRARCVRGRTGWIRAMRRLAAKMAMVCASSGCPPRSMKVFGVLKPMREPRPAAGMIAAARLTARAPQRPGRLRGAGTGRRSSGPRWSGWRW